MCAHAPVIISNFFLINMLGSIYLFLITTKALEQLQQWKFYTSSTKRNQKRHSNFSSKVFKSIFFTRSLYVLSVTLYHLLPVHRLTVFQYETVESVTTNHGNFPANSSQDFWLESLQKCLEK